MEIAIQFESDRGELLFIRNPWKGSEVEGRTTIHRSLTGVAMYSWSRQPKQESRPPVPEWAASHPAWVRLADQLGWYDRTSTNCQNRYKVLKFVQITLAVSIPLLVHLDPTYAKWVTSLAGALIAVLEGVQHLNQYSTLWVIYRSTAEHLKHEKFLFLSAAGPYKGQEQTERLITLAERVEEHVSTEHANWFNETRRAVSPTQKETGR